MPLLLNRRKGIHMVYVLHLWRNNKFVPGGVKGTSRYFLTVSQEMFPSAGGLVLIVSMHASIGYGVDVDWGAVLKQDWQRPSLCFQSSDT